MLCDPHAPWNPPAHALCVQPCAISRSLHFEVSTLHAQLTPIKETIMFISRIHVESVPAHQDDPVHEPALTDLEWLQEHEELRVLRAITARRRRPMIAERSSAD